MFIVWGTKIVRKKVGRLADFCRLCRDFQPARVTEVQSVGHIYYLPIGSRKFLGSEIACEGCGLTHVVDDPYADIPVWDDRHADVDVLLAETNPAAEKNWADRLAFEARMRSGGLTPEERQAAVLESFMLVEALAARRAQEQSIDPLSVLGILASLFIILPLLIGATVSMRLGPETEPAAIIGGIVVVGAANIVVFAGAGRRYARKKLLPILTRALRPLKPSGEEIETALETLRRGKGLLPKRLKAAEIEAALETQSEWE
jgi:hypothetical protein